MKRKDIYKKLTSEEEISSIIYSLIATADRTEKKQGNLRIYNPINFLISCLYDKNMPIYNHLSFITRKGGARYIMNDVSSYRFIKKYQIEEVKSLKELFKTLNCNTKEDIIKLVNNIYIHRNNEITQKTECIKQSLLAFQVYYKNDISLDSWPSKNQIYSDYLTNFINKATNDPSFMDSCIGLGTNQNHGSRVLTMKHIRYFGVKMIIIADGTGYTENENAAYKFCEYMNEWFWKANPYIENFENELNNTIKLINFKIGEICNETNDYTKTSASVIIVTPKNTYISSVGNTRVYIIKNGKITKIKHKESLYDDIKEKGKIMPFTKEYAQSIPYDEIGYPINKMDNCNPETTTILTPFIDGILAISYGVYNNTTDEEIETILKNCNLEDTAEAISSKAEFGIITNPKYKKLFTEKKVNGSNAVAIYKTNRKSWTKRKQFDIKVK